MQTYKLAGVDKFHRSFSRNENIDNKKEVGMFFWLWIGHPAANGVYDASKILSLPEGKDMLFFKDSPQSPNYQQHFWGEPIWGYYNSGDKWVIRKQIELLMIAGVDFLVFDTTNALIYENVYENVLEAIEAFQKEGLNPPRAAFYTHSHSIATVMSLYENLYKPEKYKSTWYCKNGKPMIIGYTDPQDDLAECKTRGDSHLPPDMPDEIKEFFYFKRPQWPFDPVYENGFPWIEWTFPQPLHGDTMSVSVASHPNVPFSFTLTRGLENWGRGWDPEKKENVKADVDKGAFFEKQWDTAISAGANTVFVGGWNEWVALKSLWDGEYMLCDAVDKEFSRDIEPMKGGYEDAFLIQLARNIRKFKTSRMESVASFQGAEKFYADSPEPIERNDRGVSHELKYFQKKPDNSIKSIELSRKNDALVFSIEFRENIIEKRENPAIFSFFVAKGEIPYEQNIRIISAKLHEGRGLSAQEMQISGWDKADEVINAKLCFDESSLRIYLPVSSFLNTSVCFKGFIGARYPENKEDFYVEGSALPTGSFYYCSKRLKA